MTVEELIQELQPQLRHLSMTYKIPGFTREDLYQQLCLKVIQDFEDDDTKEKGWWFTRLKWHCNALSRRSRRDPLSRTIDISNVAF